MTEISVEFDLNGHATQVDVEPIRTLLSVLRQDIGLTGTKDGCSSGDCGACAVLVDGQVMNSCMMLAVQADGSQITTVEGLGTEDDLHPLQRTFAETWAFQCGFCTPGMLISCVALLRSNEDPSREEILSAISGNFCRCTAYQNVVTAVQRAGAEMRGGMTEGNERD